MVQVRECIIIEKKTRFNYPFPSPSRALPGPSTESSTLTPLSPSRLLLHTLPSSKTSLFQISALFFTSSKASSPAAHALFLCGLETAICILSSPMPTSPSRCVIAIPTRPCFSLIAWAIVCSVRSASGVYVV